MASIPTSISRRSLRAPDAPASGQPPFAEAGLRVGRWVLRAPLGAGAFGVTWRAVRDDGLVGALKLLGTPPGDELRVLSRLCHPAIPMLLDHGGSRPAFVVTELVEGAPTVLSAPRTAEGIEGVGASLLDALAAVHQTGHAHGDVKPENVLVSHDDNCVHLIDFGLSDSKGGTLAWAAPERLRGEPARPPADVYAVGLMLYALLHGALPWSELPVGEAAAAPLIPQGFGHGTSAALLVAACLQLGRAAREAARLRDKRGPPPPRRRAPAVTHAPPSAPPPPPARCSLRCLRFV